MPSCVAAAHRGHDDVAGFRELYRHVHHPIVAGMQQHRDGAAADPCSGVDRAHVRLERAGPALRFVDRRDTELAERVNGLLIGAIDVPNRNCLHHESPAIRVAVIRWGPGPYTSARL